MTELKKSLFDEITESPKEHYTFRYSVEELMPISKVYLREYIKKKLPALTVLLILFVISVFRASYSACAIGGMLFSILVYNYNICKGYKKRFKMSNIKVAENVYDYTVYEYFFVIWISSNYGLRQKRVVFSDVKAARIIGDLLVIELEDRLYTLRRSELDENSAFLKLCGKKKK